MPGVTYKNRLAKVQHFYKMETHFLLPAIGGGESHKQADQIGDPQQRQWHMFWGYDLRCEPASMEQSEPIARGKKWQLVAIAGILSSSTSY